MNAPDGNTLSTAELTMALMLAVSRHIAHACASLKAGKWDKKSFMGNLLAGKTVGIVGLGRIGKAVAKRCLAFDMKVVGYDPFVAGAAGDLAKQITIVGTLDELLKQANYLTVHTPADRRDARHHRQEGTGHAAEGRVRHQRGPRRHHRRGGPPGGPERRQPRRRRPRRLHQGTASRTARLVDHPKVTCLPHLGASSHEAQRNVSIDACHNIIDYLAGRELRGAVNVPAINFAAAGALKPYAELGHRMGAILAGLMHGRLKRLTVTYGGDIAREPYNRVTISVVMGMLQRVVVDAPQRGQRPAGGPRERRRDRRADQHRDRRLRLEPPRRGRGRPGIALGLRHGLPRPVRRGSWPSTTSPWN